MEKYNKSQAKTVNLKYLLQYGTTNLNYLMDHILYLILKIILRTSLKHETVTDNPPIRISVNNIQNRITFKVTTSLQTEEKSIEIPRKGKKFKKERQ